LSGFTRGPILSVSDVRELLGATFAGANQIVQRLMDPKILAEITGQVRNRRFPATTLTCGSLTRKRTHCPQPLRSFLQEREELIASIVGRMPDAHRRFLISFKKCESDWPLLVSSGVEGLPAVQWRLDNLLKMKKDKREALGEQLRKVLAQGC